MTKRVSSVGLLAFVVFLTAPCWAQSDRATLTGTVSDPTQAFIAGVKVTATNLATKVLTSTTTNDVGIYRILNLPVGQYSLLFQKEGFESVERTGITLTISQVAEIDVTLKLGVVAQAVEVNARAPILESQTSDTGSTMTLEAYRALPLNISGGRDIMAFAFATTPSVEGNSWTSYIAGTQAFSNEVLIDGTLAQESETGQELESEPPMEAVEEFRVDTGGMGGAAGMYTAGGTFMFTLKSGTNQFHGSAVYFNQNEAFGANSWMNDYNAAANPSDASLYAKPRNRHNDYAFSAGGPIIKNKTFIFGAFEQYRMSNYTIGSYNKTVPTADFLNGDFSGLLGSPLCTQSDGSVKECSSGGTPINVQNTNGQSLPLQAGMIFDPAHPGQVFPNNTIDPSRFSNVAKQIIPVYQQYYKPLTSGLINNNALTLNNSPWFHQTQFSIKVDHNFSDKNRLASSFIWTERPRVLVDSGGIWDAQDSNGTGGPLSTSRYQKVSDRKFRLSDSHNFTPNVLNVAALTYERFRNPSITTHPGDWNSKLGFGDTGAKNFPSIGFGSSVNGYWEDPIGNTWGGFLVNNNYVVDDTLTWIKGRHTISFGGEMRMFQMNTHGANGTLGFNFGNDQTGAPTTKYKSYVGFGFASFLLGDVASASEGAPFDLYGRRKSLSTFVNDSFKVNGRLTLNYGLNWNQTYPFHEKYGHWASFDTTAMNSSLGIPGEVAYLHSGGQSFEGSTRWSGFAPHLGIAYKINNRIVARAAYSLFDIPIGTDYWGGVPYSFAPGYFPTNQVPANADFSPAFNWDNGYPGKFVYGTLDPNFLQWTMVTISPETLQVGITNQWNAGVQVELTKDTRLSLNYLATRGSHLHDGSLQQNEGPPSAYTDLLTNGDPWGWTCKANYCGSTFAFLSPFPQIANNWDQLFYVASPKGWSKYDAFQAEVTRRAARGLTMDMSYTLARQSATSPLWYGTQGSNFQESWASWTWLQNLYDLSAAGNYIQPFNQSIVKGYVLYTLPFGNGRHLLSNRGRVVNAVVGDWTVGTTLYYSTGTPLSVYSSNWYPGLSSAIYPVVASGADLSRHFDNSKFIPDSNNPGFVANNRYFSPAGFSNPAYGNFGNSGPYVAGLNSFGTDSENVAIYKDFKFKERFKLQFRAEFFNLFNRHSFDNPNTTINSPYFGDVMTVGGTPRIGQLGARFEW